MIHKIIIMLCVFGLGISFPLRSRGKAISLKPYGGEASREWNKHQMKFYEKGKIQFSERVNSANQKINTRSFKAKKLTRKTDKSSKNEEKSSFDMLDETIENFKETLAEFLGTKNLHKGKSDSGENRKNEGESLHNLSDIYHNSKVERKLNSRLESNKKISIDTLDQLFDKLKKDIPAKFLKSAIVDKRSSHTDENLKHQNKCFNHFSRYGDTNMATGQGMKTGIHSNKPRSGDTLAPIFDTLVKNNPPKFFMSGKRSYTDNSREHDENPAYDFNDKELLSPRPDNKMEFVADVLDDENQVKAEIHKLKKLLWV